MGKALPIIATIAIGVATGGLGLAASSVMAGTATFSQFAMVAGTALSGIGALTGKKDLMKIGGFMSLAGGLGQAFGGAAIDQATGEVVKEAATDAAIDQGGDALGEQLVEEAADDVTKEAIGSVGGATQSATDAAAAEAAAAGAQPDQLGSTLGKLGAAPPASDAISGNSTLMGFGGAQAGPVGSELVDLAGGGNLMTNPGVAESFNSTSLMSSGMPQSQIDTMLGRTASPSFGGAGNALMDAGKGMNQSSIGKYLTSAEKWAKEHKTVLDIGLKGLASMTDPNQRALEDRRRMMSRYRDNLNSPVALGNIGKG